MNVSAANSKITLGNRPYAISNGADDIIVKVRLRDYDNQPIPNRLVELIADSENVSIVQPELTDSDGAAIGYITATEPGDVAVTAIVYPASSA